MKYVTNTAFGNCTAGVIDPTGFDSVEVNPHTVRLRNPNQFFDLDGSFQYEGVVSSRSLVVSYNTNQVNKSKSYWYLVYNTLSQSERKWIPSYKQEVMAETKDTSLHTFVWYYLILSSTVPFSFNVKTRD